MKSVLTFLVNFSIMMFTVLFDKDGGEAYGLTWWPETPTAMISIAEFLVNIVWLLGIFYVLGTIALVIMAIYADELIEKAYKKYNSDEFYKIGRVTTWGNLTLAAGFLGSLFAVGSGFWFTGTAWFLLQLSVVWATVEARKEKIKILS